MSTTPSYNANSGSSDFQLVVEVTDGSSDTDAEIIAVDVVSNPGPNPFVCEA